MVFIRKCMVLTALVAVLNVTPAHAVDTDTEKDMNATANREQHDEEVNAALRYIGVLADAWFGAVAANERVEANRGSRSPAGESGSRPRSAAPAAPSSGHDPCAEPMNGLLPTYIVQRESRGDCGAYNHGGCGGRGCLGWAQIDEGHFSANSPWGSGPGSCYGLSYNACVSKLSNGGTNLGPWRCC